VAGGSRELSAAGRAHWLAELSEALDDAQEILWRMGPRDVRHADALDLWASIEAARAEVRLLRIGRPDRAVPHFHPEWTNQGPWD
jgi:hypothetical protein